MTDNPYKSPESVGAVEREEPEQRRLFSLPEKVLYCLGGSGMLVWGVWLLWIGNFVVGPVACICGVGLVVSVLRQKQIQQWVHGPKRPPSIVNAIETLMLGLTLLLIGCYGCYAVYVSWTSGIELPNPSLPSEMLLFFALAAAAAAILSSLSFLTDAVQELRRFVKHSPHLENAKSEND